MAMTLLDVPAASSCTDPNTTSPSHQEGREETPSTPTIDALPPLCKHWARSKVCLYHNKGLCRFDHPPDHPPIIFCGGGCCVDEGGAECYGDDNAADVAGGTADGGTSPAITPGGARPHAPRPRHRSAGGRLKVRNDSRVAVFRAFVAAEWERAHGHDEELEEADDGGKTTTTTATTTTTTSSLGQTRRHPLAAARILDVAGGKGEMAFQFLNLCHVESCHVVDPRPLSVRRFQHWLERGFYHRSQLALHSEIVTRQEDISAHPRPVGHLRCFFTEELWQSQPRRQPRPSASSSSSGSSSGSSSDGAPDEGTADPASDCDDSDPSSTLKFQSNREATERWSWPPKPNLTHHPDKLRPRGGNPAGGDHRHASDDDTGDEDRVYTPLPTLDEAAAVTRNATLIVGMHPDQAVDAIVDAALALDVSFFVVPCCTYSQEFPHRRYRGRPVTKYDDLLGYLEGKAPPGTIRRAVLDFEGRNVCLYRVVAAGGGRLQRTSVTDENSGGIINEDT